MQNSYNCRNIVTDKYSNNNQAAKSASVLSNSIKMANKPLFLVAAAMLMLIFFTGTAHASTFPVTSGFTLSPSSATMYPASGQSTTFTVSGIESGYSVSDWYITATQGIDSIGGVTGSCSTLSGNNAGSSTLTLTYGESFTCHASDGNDYTFSITPTSGPFTIQVIACSTSGDCVCSGGSCSIENSSVSTLSFVSPLSTPTLTLDPTAINFGQTSSEATIQWTGGTSPYTVNIYDSIGSSCSSSSTLLASVPSSDITTTNGGTPTAVYSPISLPSGTSGTVYNICASVTDSSSTPVTVLSASEALTSYPPISLNTPALSQPAIDAGQSVTVSTIASGGSGSYSTADLLDSSSSSGTFTQVGYSYCEFTVGCRARRRVCE